jgi:hypothetical protein
MKSLSPAIIVGLLLGIVGLALGYGIFGKIGSEYVDLDVIFSANKNFFQKAVRSMIGIDEMRSKILWCGVGGAVLGIILGLMPGRRR